MKKDFAPPAHDNTVMKLVFTIKHDSRNQIKIKLKPNYNIFGTIEVNFLIASLPIPIL